MSELLLFAAKVYLSGVVLFCVAASWYGVCAFFKILGPYDIVKKKSAARPIDLAVLFLMYPFVLGGTVVVVYRLLF
jgi:hypothetical protein